MVAGAERRPGVVAARAPRRVRAERPGHRPAEAVQQPHPEVAVAALRPGPGAQSREPAVLRRYLEPVVEP
ncbi:MAG: hypothetical protein ABGX91_01295, partial [Thermoleophilia bacterium]